MFIAAMKMIGLRAGLLGETGERRIKGGTDGEIFWGVDAPAGL